MTLRPFWRYYGGKWRAVQADAYPQPIHGTIVEPFAGAAGYSLRFGVDRAVILVERYPTVAAIWRYLISADPAEIRAIPEVDRVDDLPDWVPQPARDLVGFTMGFASSRPKRTLSKAAVAHRAANRKFEGWSPAQRERVASQVTLIRHWQIIEGEYTCAPDIEATWYIDGPYKGRPGRRYVYGSTGLDYVALAAWCRARRGQPIVCEQLGAEWLPFRRLGAFKAAPRSNGDAGTSHEAVWP